MKALFYLLASTAFIVTTATRAEPAIIKLGSNIELIPLDETSYVVNQVSDPYQANGLLVISSDEYILIDTKNRQQDADLIYRWITSRTTKPQITVINSHFHQDAAGTNSFYKSKGAKIMASSRTAEIFKIGGYDARQPTETYPLQPKTNLVIGNEQVELIFPGASHAPDNIVGQTTVQSLHRWGRVSSFCGAMASSTSLGDSILIYQDDT